VLAWGRLSRILSSEVATKKAVASIYKAVVQAILLYGSDSWTLTTAMGKKLQSFHHRCARYIAKQHIKMNLDGTWTHLARDEILKTTGLCTIQEYINLRRETILKYTRSTQIYSKCLLSKANNPKQLVWWDLINEIRNNNTIASVS
jgi:hypothetical protein